MGHRESVYDYRADEEVSEAKLRKNERHVKIADGIVFSPVNWLLSSTIDSKLCHPLVSSQKTDSS